MISRGNLATLLRKYELDPLYDIFRVYLQHSVVKVCFDGSGDVTPGEYVGIGRARIFQYDFALKLAFEKGQIVFPDPRILRLLS